MSNHCTTCVGKSGAPKCHTPLACGVPEVDDGWREADPREVVAFVVIEAVAIIGFIAAVGWVLEFV